jgi:hypothetical protein
MVRFVLPAVGIVVVLIALTPMHVRPDFTTDKSIMQSAPSVAAAASGAYRLTLWHELLPPAWKSMPPFRNEDVSKLDDADPRARALLARMRSTWDEAPANAALNGAAIRTAGYVVPIEESREGLHEFLLVPYYGACIHIPPPPANQIIDVSTSRPVKGLDSMDTVWVEGVLKVVRTTHDSGASTYAMRADDIEPYTGPSR